MNLIIDSNVWLRQDLLRSPTGLSLTACCYRYGYKIILPEVVEKETVINFFNNAVENRSNIEKAYKFLLTTVGKMQSIDLPTDNALQEVFRLRIQKLNEIVERRSNTLEQLEIALEMVLNYLPPNYKGNQQFKDSAIWAACLDEAKYNDVAFITNDNGFYKNKKVANGLAENIKRDISDTDNKITFYNGAKEFLETHFNTDELVNIELLAKQLFIVEEQILQNHISEFELDIIGIEIVDFKKFITAEDNQIAIDYVGEIILDNKDSSLDPFYKVEGSCFYNVAKKEIINNSLSQIQFKWIDIEKSPQERTSVNIAVGGNFRISEYKLKYKI